jgi:hypothetical protein
LQNRSRRSHSATGSKKPRFARRNETLVCSKFDRCARSTTDLLITILGAIANRAWSAPERAKCEGAAKAKLTESTTAEGPQHALRLQRRSSSKLRDCGERKSAVAQGSASQHAIAYRDCPQSVSGGLHREEVLHEYSPTRSRSAGHRFPSRPGDGALARCEPPPCCVLSRPDARWLWYRDAVPVFIQLERGGGAPLAQSGRWHVEHRRGPGEHCRRSDSAECHQRPMGADQP